MTDLRRGIVRTLSLTDCCRQAHTFPHVTADSRVYILSRIGIVHIGDPPNQVVLPLSSHTHIMRDPHNLQLNSLLVHYGRESTRCIATPLFGKQSLQEKH